MEHIIWCIGHELVLKDIVKAENCFLYDSKGKKYLDLESGVWCTSIGHSNPRINQVIKSQIDKISHTGYCYANPVIEESAKDILETLNFSEGKCVFLCSGSEAVEFGVRIAQCLSERPLLLTMTDSYFGAYGSASKRSEDEWYSFDWLKCSGCPSFEDCNPECDRLLGIPFDKIGGFLFEPGSSSGLVRFPPKKLIQNITQRVKENNGLLIINEVTTGLGRTGEWYGYQHYDLQPDIVALGKGLGNGYPVSVTAVTQHVFEKLENKPFKYSQSHQNDPLGATVAREVIRVIREEKLIERSKVIGNYFIDKLRQLAHRYSAIKEVRGRGLMIAIEFGDSNSSLAALIQKELLNEGFIVASRPGANAIRIDPPLTIEEKDIASFINSFGQVLKRIL